MSLYFVTTVKENITPQNIVLIGKCKGGTQRFLRDRYKRENFYLFVAEEEDIERFLNSIGSGE